MPKPPFRLLTIGLLSTVLGAGLSGCVWLGEKTGLPNPFEVSRPFEGAHRNLVAVSSITAGAAIRIAYIDGLAQSQASALSEALINAAEDNNIIIATTSTPDRADQLAGSLYVTHQGSAPVLSLAWTLTDSAGEPRETFMVRRVLPPPGPNERQQSVRSRITNADLTALALDTAQRLRAGVDAAQGRTASGTAARPLILLAGITGAPGDGERMLSGALAALLAESGYRTARPSAELAALPAGAFRIDGRVRVTPLPGGALDQVELAWRVSDSLGRELGTVTQANQVPAGLLDERWGMTAADAAFAARAGLLDLILKAPLPPG